MRNPVICPLCNEEYWALYPHGTGHCCWNCRQKPIPKAWIPPPTPVAAPKGWMRRKRGESAHECVRCGKKFVSPSEITKTGAICFECAELSRKRRIARAEKNHPHRSMAEAARLIGEKISA